MRPFSPEEAQVNSWVRTYTRKRGKSFEIKDKYQLKEITDSSLKRFWPDNLTRVRIVWRQPELSGDCSTVGDLAENGIWK
ncbi:MAG: hypothetical protein LBS04_03355 [Tannerellaceae bacterium]|nr:hypothetical protein [Tannerellaceae bacterium]